MGVPAEFSKRLHEAIGAHSAWPPVTNSFGLGDYGLVSDGIFQRLGNIQEFDIGFASSESPAADLDMKSSDATRVAMVANVVVDALPPAPIDAKLRIELGGKGSYYAKATRMTSVDMTNVGQVAGALERAPGWRRKYRVVRSVIVAHDCLLVTASADQATFELSGNADVLNVLNIGAAGASVSITNDTNIGVTIVGRTGVIGLRLFKLKWFSGDPRFLKPGEEADFDDATDDELEDDV